MTIPIKGSPKYLQFIEKYKTAQEALDKTEKNYLNYLKAKVEEFYNHTHDAKGRFAKTTGENGNIPADEMQVVQSADSKIQAPLTAMLFDRRRVEPAYTSLLQKAAEQSGGEMLGLDFKFKGANGIVGKVARKVAEKGLTPEEAIKTIADPLRYTVSLPPERYIEGMRTTVKALLQSGAKFESLENNWKPGDAYNGVNAVFVDPKTGLKIELQFHTPESFHVKDHLIHKDYEFVRERKGSSAQRLLALERMRKISDSVEFPKEISTLTGDIHGVKVTPMFRPFQETLFAAGQETPTASSWEEAERLTEAGDWTQGDWEDWVDAALGQSGPDTSTITASIQGVKGVKGSFICHLKKEENADNGS